MASHFIKPLLCVLLGVLVSTAQADTVSYTNVIADTATDWTNTVPLMQFSPSLGTLTSVQVSVLSDVSTVLMVTNTGSSASSGYASTLFSLFLTSSPYLDLFSVGNVTNAVSSYNTPLFNYSLPVGGSVTSGAIPDSSLVTSSVLTNLSTLNAFTGNGYFGLTFSTLTYAGIFNVGGNSASTETTVAGLTVINTYTYTGVPEPATWASLVMGLAGFGMMWHRRIKARQRRLIV